MLADILASDSMRWRIIELFRKRGHLSAAEILALLNSSGPEVSQRGVYRELEHLIEHEVVVKVKHTYTLSLPWILRLSRFADELYDFHTSRTSLKNILPKRGIRKRWRFNDLRRMDTFWLQLMLVLLKKSSPPVMYEWAPLFWFHLVHHKKELEMQSAMEMEGFTLYIIFGGRSYIHTLAESYLSKGGYEWSYGESPFHNKSDRYLCVVKDYVLTVKIAPKKMKEIAQLFAEIKERSDLDPARIAEVLQTPTRATVILENNPAKSARLLKKFKDFFGH